ncbi:phage portal protein [Clostridium sporogenes]|uniref:phage portal protein n=1 Tax=Clostridium sporogenes TaxID=1509 RepID=UPI002236FB4C|nr:phage portal protein [Clostridium sporogenes]MCW6059775.1 phage portal protein [Clostridium sporogenes]MCW6067272.1 phage portal protein [Clostridium sporogenes]
MGIISSIKNFIFKTPYKLFVGGGNNRFSFTSRDLATNETIFAAVTMLSNGVASAPLSVREDYRKLKPRENNLARLFEYGPNPNMTTFQFIRCMETIRNTKGTAYAIKEYDYHHNIEAIWILKNEYVEPVRDQDTKELYYKIRCDGSDRYVHNSHIIVVNHISEDGYTAINPLDVLKNTIQYDQEIKEFSLNQMKNGLKANMVIKLQSKLNEESIKLYEEMIQRFQKNGILFVDSGKEFQELKNNSFIDPKTFEVEEITVSRVARVYNIPLGKLIGGKNSYASAEQSDLEYMKDTILPIVRMYEQEFSKKCITERDRDNGIQAKMSLNGFARGDMNTRGNFYFKGIRSTWFCANDIRALEDMPPIPGGDVFYISRDMCPIDKIDLLLKGGEKNGE